MVIAVSSPTATTSSSTVQHLHPLRPLQPLLHPLPTRRTIRVARRRMRKRKRERLLEAKRGSTRRQTILQRCSLLLRLPSTAPIRTKSSRSRSRAARTTVVSIGRQILRSSHVRVKLPWRLRTRSKTTERTRRRSRPLTTSRDHLIPKGKTEMPHTMCSRKLGREP